MTPALTVSNVSYSIAGLDILKQLKLEVEPQQYYAIAGVNGAGKSTLIKLMLDLIRPAPGGNIQIFGLPNTDPQCREQLVYLPEKFDVKKNISGRQYLEFIASVYHAKFDMRKVAELAERLDFAPDRLGFRIGSYSKGMVLYRYTSIGSGNREFSSQGHKILQKYTCRKARRDRMKPIKLATTWPNGHLIVATTAPLTHYTGTEQNRTMAEPSTFFQQPPHRQSNWWYHDVGYMS